jgi:hypothetical protein
MLSPLAGRYALHLGTATGNLLGWQSTMGNTAICSVWEIGEEEITGRKASPASSIMILSINPMIAAQARQLPERE